MILKKVVLISRAIVSEPEFIYGLPVGILSAGIDCRNMVENRCLQPQIQKFFSVSVWRSRM